MTTFLAQDNTSPTMIAGTTEGRVGSIPAQEQGASGGGGDVEFFKMRARDAGRPPGADYIMWTSSPTPDFAGAGYGGGDPTPIGAMIPGSVVKIATIE